MERKLRLLAAALTVATVVSGLARTTGVGGAADMTHTLANEAK